MAARPLTSLAGHVWRFLTGPNIGAEEFKALAAHASERTIVERFRDDFPTRLSVRALSISQAGYNTTMDILAAGARAIVVPYEAKGETEQRLRAEILARKGPADDDPGGGAFAAAARPGGAQRRSTKPRRRRGIDVAGAATTARIVGELAAKRAAAA